MKSILIYRNLSKDSTTMRPPHCRHAFTIAATAAIAVAIAAIAVAIAATAKAPVIAVVEKCLGASQMELQSF